MAVKIQDKHANRKGLPFRKVMRVHPQLQPRQAIVPIRKGSYVSNNALCKVSPASAHAKPFPRDLNLRCGRVDMMSEGKQVKHVDTATDNYN